MTKLEALRLRLADRAEPVDDPSQLDRLAIVRAGGQLHVAFFGGPFGEAFIDLLEALVEPETAGRLASIELAGPDTGANGTKNWDIGSLVGAGVAFPNLTSFAIERARPGDHNIAIVARDYDEDGVLAPLLAAASGLASLVVPSAPNAEFFRVGERPIRYLAVDSGYDHEGFIRNLADSTCFPGLESFEFGEYRETYLTDFADRVTPFADYGALFDSTAFASVRAFVWRNPACSAEEIAALRAQGPRRSIQVVRWSVDWVG